MNFKNAIKKSGLKNSKNWMRSCGTTRYSIHYNYLELLEKWNLIYNDLDSKSIQRLEDYTSLKKFNEDAVRILKHTMTPCTAMSASFSYSYTGKEEMDEMRAKVFEKMLSKENISNFKEPYIYIVEKNRWERETWRYGIKLTTKNCEEVGKLYLHLKEMFEDSQFYMSNEILEGKNIKWERYSGYMNSPTKINDSFDITKLVKCNDKAKLETMMYKGGELL